MSLRLYADECVNGRVIAGLRRRGIELVTAADEDLLGATDEQQFARAIERGLVILSADNDLLRLAAQQMGAGGTFPGLIFIAPQSRVGEVVTAVATIAEVLEPGDMVGAIEWVS